MSKFQIFILGLFVALAVGGLLFFSIYKGVANKGPGNVVIWGSLDQRIINSYVAAALKQSNSKIVVTYVQKDKSTMYSDYLEAIAAGKGPDAMILAQDDILHYGNKIIPIPYSNFPEDQFRSAFVQEGELFLSANGILAYPLEIDPLVMYWNRDMFTNASLANPPKYWQDFIPLAPQLTSIDASQNIQRSAVGLGEYKNIDHAKEILSLLMMQAGNPIVQNQAGTYSVTLDAGYTSGSSDKVSPASSALSFYTQFADPLKQVYSWNRSLPTSKTLFTSNKLGVYFGFASELASIHQVNPNLNFDISLMPQPKAAVGSQQVYMTFGNIYGLAIAQSSKDPNTTLTVLGLLTNQSNIPLLSTYSGLPSVRRDAPVVNSDDPTSPIFATSALWARAWPDYNPDQSSTIFQHMIEDVTSGRLTPQDAITQAENDLQATYPQVSTLRRNSTSFLAYSLGGLVPCGNESDPNAAAQSCGLPQLVQLIRNVINGMIVLAIPLATIAFVYVGFTLLTAMGNVKKIEDAKHVAWYVLIGFIVILSAYLVVYTITTALLDPSYNTYLNQK